MKKTIIKKLDKTILEVNIEYALKLLPMLLEQWKEEANEAIKLIESL